MSLFRQTALCAGFALLLAGPAAGCRSASPPLRRSASTDRVQTGQEAFAAERPAIALASHQDSAGTGYVELDADDPFAGQAELQPDRLVEEVLARNPSLQATVAAWRAAAQRYPQVVSLDDPMFGFMLGPGSFGSDAVDFAYMLEASQKLPWPGKRQIRGRVARAEASAARFDIGDARLRLAEAARLAYFEYYLARRYLELNDENARDLGEFREAASAKYVASLVPQQDVLQAEVELAQLERRELELERMEAVAAARINTLLHRQADFPLPPPPRRLQAIDELPPADSLQLLALERRPDLAAQAARIRAEQANLALACREYYPDLELVTRYDAFWQEDPLRPMVGMNLNVPIRNARRRAAVREAAFRLNQRRAEFDAQIDMIQNDVQASYERARESRQAVELYRQSILPTARQNVEAAQAGYTAVTVDFLRLIEAQRQLIALEEKSYEAEADYHGRLAELERAVGGPIPQAGPREELAVPRR